MEMSNVKKASQWIWNILNKNRSSNDFVIAKIVYNDYMAIEKYRFCWYEDKNSKKGVLINSLDQDGNIDGGFGIRRGAKILRGLIDKSAIIDLEFISEKAVL